MFQLTRPIPTAESLGVPQYTQVAPTPAPPSPTETLEPEQRAYADPYFLTIQNNRFLVDHRLYNEVKNLVNDIEHVLITDRVYSASELLGHEMWSSLTAAGKRVAVLCMLDAEPNDQFAWKFDSWSDSGEPMFHCT